MFCLVYIRLQMFSRGVCVVYLFGRLFCICMHNYLLSLTFSEPIICLYAVGGFTRDTMSYHGLVPCRKWRLQWPGAVILE